MFTLFWNKKQTSNRALNDLKSSIQLDKSKEKNEDKT